MSRLSLTHASLIHATNVKRRNGVQIGIYINNILNIIEGLKNDGSMFNLTTEYSIENSILSDIKNSESKLLEFIIRISKELR